MKNIISLIIPIYNGEKYIESLIQQLNEITYKQLEIIFINNNSNDNSMELLSKVTIDLGKEFKILSEKEQGASYARNTGIKSAKGAYLAFLDCDDKIDARKFEYDIKIFQEHEVDFVLCRTLRIYEDGRTVKHPINDFKVGINLPPLLGLSWLKNFFRLQGPGAIVIKKEVVNQLGGFCNLKIGEDAHLFIRLGLLYKGYFYDEVKNFYFRHSVSTVSKNNSEKDGRQLAYFNLRKHLFNDAIVLGNIESKKIITWQLQVDILILNKKGHKIRNLINDEKLSKLKLEPIVFNPLSLLINRKVSKLYYNPFYILWRRIN